MFKTGKIFYKRRRDFKGKVIVITGAAGGLGRELCIRFGQAGAKIMALDIDEFSLDELIHDLHALGIEAKEYACDITDPAICLQTIEQIQHEYLTIDVLIHNAGMTHRSPFQSTRLSVILKVIEVNLLGSIYLTHAAINALVKNKGMIIVVSSVAGFAPLIARTGYAAGKHGLHGFFESLRAELTDAEVSIMMACPSFIETGLEKNALKWNGERATHPRQNIGKVVSPAQVAGQIFRAAEREKRLLLSGNTAVLSYWVSRIFPRIYEKIMARKLQGEMLDE